jgi:hypothetical protein
MYMLFDLQWGYVPINLLSIENIISGNAVNTPNHHSLGMQNPGRVPIVYLSYHMNDPKL